MSLEEGASEAVGVMSHPRLERVESIAENMFYDAELSSDLYLGSQDRYSHRDV